MGRITRRVILALTIAVVLLVTTSIYYVLRTRSRAQGLLQVVRSIEVGKMDLKQAADMLGQYGRVRQTQPCDGDKCSYAVYVSNRLVRQLHLFPLTELNVVVSGASGVVDEVYVAYKSSNGGEFVGVSIANRSCYPCYEGQKPFLISRTRDSISRKAVKAIVELTPLASPSQKEEVYKLNLGCLTKIGGCADAKELAPSLWQTSKDGMNAPES